MPRLTEYLLRLATNVEELEKYRKLYAEPHGKEKLHDYLTKTPHPGLTVEQAKAVAGNDSHRVVEAVIEELTSENSRPDNPFYGIAVTFVTEVNNHVQHYRP